MMVSMRSISCRSLFQFFVQGNLLRVRSTSCGSSRDILLLSLFYFETGVGLKIFSDDGVVNR
jgi:hypothetical protein